ncbi:hypothetical protein D3C87_2157070 [compost metagenome]
MMPCRQPRLPALQSVSQPEVLTIIWPRLKSFGACSSDMIISAWFGTTWQTPAYLS